VRYLKKESGALISLSALTYLWMREEEQTHGHGIVVGNINIDPPHPRDCRARVRHAASQRRGRRRWPLSCFFPLPNHHCDGNPMMTNTMPPPHPTSAPPLALALAIAAKTGNLSGLFRLNNSKSHCAELLQEKHGLLTIAWWDRAQRKHGHRLHHRA
jgi:hypothetical protein